MFYSKRDLYFQLFELADCESLCQYPYFQDHDKESFMMVLDAAEAIAEKMLLPLLTEMDRNEPQLIDGKIRIHEGMKAIIKKMGEDGWVNAAFDYEEGGQQLPTTILNAAGFIFQAANYSSSIFTYMSGGASNLIRTFGSKELIETFTPAIYSGKWQATMALTEPDAGSSLSDIITAAEPTSQEGVYKIKGQKIYISAGDHDACENVVHLMLAKIKGAPLGAKGISLFVVPQKRIEGDSLVWNDVTTAGIFHKMGYKGAPIAHLSMGASDDCYGYLVGEPHKGLSYMFQLMNEARVTVGMNATAIGTAAYYASLNYAKERPQGRKISEKNPQLPQTPIINHADVKRMLLFQKSVVEGSLSLLIYCSKLADLIHVEIGDAKEKYALLLDLLTPIAKSYPSEMCCLSTSAAVQTLGGAGYTTDFPVEQFYREARIHPIHEGTTGIHGIDLLGRKVSMQHGKAAQILFIEIETSIEKAMSNDALKPYAEKLRNYILKVQEVTQHLLSLAQQGETEKYLADATLYLEMFGIVTIAWQWLQQAETALRRMEQAHAEDKNFYQGKWMTMKYFYEYELVKIEALAMRMKSDNSVTVDMQGDWF